MYTVVGDLKGGRFLYYNEKEELCAVMEGRKKPLIKSVELGSGSENTIDIAPGRRLLGYPRRHVRCAAVWHVGLHGRAKNFLFSPRRTWLSTRPGAKSSATVVRGIPVLSRVTRKVWKERRKLVALLSMHL